MCVCEVVDNDDAGDDDEITDNVVLLKENKKDFCSIEPNSNFLFTSSIQTKVTHVVAPALLIHGFL